MPEQTPPTTDAAQQVVAASTDELVDKLINRLDFSAITGEALARTVSKTPPPPETPELAPPGFRVENYAASADGMRRSPAATVQAERDTDGRTGAYYQMARMINAMKGKNVDAGKLEDAYKKLIKAGHYDHQLAERVEAHTGQPMIDTARRRSSPDDYAEKAISVLRAPFTASGGNTVTFGDGGVFVPDIVIDEVQMQRDVYGVVSRYARRVPLVWGVSRYPKLTTKARFVHLGEGAEFTASKNAFGSVSMTPRKAGVILPWTREMNDMAGAAIMPAVNQLIAENREKLLDDDAFKGDGTSTYGGIVGILNHGDVASYTLGTGKTTFASADWNDFTGLKFTTGLDEGSAVGSIYVCHPFSEQYLLNLNVPQFSLQDPGAPVAAALGYMPGTNGAPARFANTIVAFTEAMNAPSTTAISTPFFVYGNFSNLMYGELNGIMIETMTEGSISDPDGGTDIKLGAQDYIGLKIKVFVDVAVTFGSAFAKMVTAAA